MLRRGDVVRLEGPNGSGKTSLLRRLAGLPAYDGTPADQPRIEPLESGCASPGISKPPQAKRTAEFLMQDPFDNLVGLTVAGEARLRDAALPESLRTWANRPSLQLSWGQARRVGLLLASDSRILLLDEPLDAMDEEGRALMRTRIAQTALSGAVVLVDPTGLADDLVTRRHIVAPSPPANIQPLSVRPAPSSPVLVAKAAVIARTQDGEDLRSPGLRLGPGLHVLHGSNGCGKSTLLMGLAGILDPALVEGLGTQVDGDTPRAGETTRILFQRAADHLHLPTARQQLEAAGCDIEWRGRLRQDLAERHPLSLSGGEAQQVALLAVLGRPARCFLLDEPEAHLDAAGWTLLRDLLGQRIREGSCILAATHDARLSSWAQSVVAWSGP